MEQNLTIVEELRAKLAEKKFDGEMLDWLKARLEEQPPDKETAEAIEALLLAQQLDVALSAELFALRLQYMPEPRRELKDDELNNVSGGCFTVPAINKLVAKSGDTMRKLVNRLGASSKELDRLCKKYRVGPDQRLTPGMIVEIYTY